MQNSARIHWRWWISKFISIADTFWVANWIFPFNQWTQTYTHYSLHIYYAQQMDADLQKKKKQESFAGNKIQWILVLIKSHFYGWKKWNWHFMSMTTLSAEDEFFFLCYITYVHVEGNIVQKKTKKSEYKSLKLNRTHLLCILFEQCLIKDNYLEKNKTR